MKHAIVNSDCLEAMRAMATDSVDLALGSPPYEDCRTYGIDYKLKGDEWVQWSADRYEECSRVCRGLVAWVVAGKTRQFRWSATPALLMAELHRRGLRLRNPPIFHRIGIPGSGGPDWLRSDYEWIVCASAGKLPWSDNTAMGTPPKHKTGGAMSYRTKDGHRRNAKTGKRLVGNNGRPVISNPGNVIHMKVGGGLMGSKLAHENEAPYPEKLAEFFILSFCPPGGTVLDPFGGSGTTAAVAKRLGRNSISIDVRESQCELVGRRLQEVTSDG